MRTIPILAAAVALSATPAWADRKVDEAYAKAIEQLSKNRADDARKTMDKVVKDVPGAESLTAMARFQIRTGAFEEAAKTADAAVKAAASAPPEVKADALIALATTDLLRGSGKDAVAHADEAVKTKESPTTLAALARAQARTNNPAAKQTAEKAVQAGATTAVAHVALGEALQASGQHADAAGAFRKALELDPKLGMGRVGLARSLLAQGKPAEAVAEARKATEADPQMGEAFAVLGTAQLAENPNAWGEAIAQAQQGAFLNPRHPAVQVAVGKLFESAGNLDQAAAAYKKALEADPDFAPARAALINIQIRKGDLDAVLPELKKALAATPNDAELNLMLGRVLMRKNQFLESVEPLEKATAGLPGSAEAHALLGTAYQYAQQSDDALKAYEKAVQLDAKNVNYQSTYGLLLGLNKQYDKAIGTLKKVVDAPGYKDTAGWTNIGWVYRSVEPPRAEDSIAAYKKALEFDAKNAQAALGLGWASSYAKKYDEAIAAFQQAIKLDPKTSAEALNGIAWGYYFKKDMAQAKATAEKAKAEGRNVTSLLSAIDKFEKGLAQAEDAERQFREEQQKARAGGDDVGTLGGQLMRGPASQRLAAARGLAKFGAQAVELLVFAAVNDKDFGVRAAAIESLGAIGPAARVQACPQLRGITRFEISTIADKAEMEYGIKMEDLKGPARAAMQKIGCN